MNDRGAVFVEAVTSKGAAFFAWMLAHQDADVKDGLTAFEAGVAYACGAMGVDPETLTENVP